MKITGLKEFIKKFRAFSLSIPRDHNIAIETRNPNYLNRSYFQFLNEMQISPVFVQGYYMPAIKDIYYHFRDLINVPVVIRLMGPDRQKIESLSQGSWDKIIIPKDGELADITKIIDDLDKRSIKVFVNVNNHYEGSAPLTIRKLQELVSRPR
ncbi:MAG: DUF72 domain-containing protein [Acidobacteriota bacterium]